MAEKVTIARPYAKAAFEYARERDGLAPWSEILATASAVVADERVARLLLNPRVAPADIVALIAEACGAGFSEQADNFLNTLAHNRRLGVLPQIATLYEMLRAQAENVADVHVTSAAPLDPAQRQRLAAALTRRLKREIRLYCGVDASLIGGAIVRAGDFVIDGSLKARLNRLAAEMMH